MNQEEISQLHGAYEVAFCDQYKNPISPWMWIAPRTMFDEEITIDFISEAEQYVTGIISRDGLFKKLGPFVVPPGARLFVTAGTRDIAQRIPRHETSPA